MEKITIGVLAGSTRRESLTLKIAHALMALMPADLEPTLLEIGDLPLFNQDYDDDGLVPESWLRLRAQVAGCGGFVFLTPEYNRGVPPMLKNAVDIASRPQGHNLWVGKPGMVAGVSPGRLGAFGACQLLRQSLGFLDVRLMAQPEVYLGGAADLLDEKGALTDAGTGKFLGEVAAAFGAWVREAARG